MNYNDKISEIVENALVEKTFNLDIITKIKALKDDFETITKSYDDKVKVTEALTKLNEAARAENTRLAAENAAYLTREAALMVKEKKADEQAYELRFQKERANEIKELFGIVFKNPVMQSNVMRNTQKPVQTGSYLNSVSESETTIETIL